MALSLRPWAIAATRDAAVEIGEGNEADGQVPAAPAENEGAAPALTRAELQDALRELWADTLDLDPGDIADDSHFFELGGNSLAAAELVALATRQYPTIRFSREMAFQAPRLADMASLISLAGVAAHAGDDAHVEPFSLVDQGDVGLAREQCGDAYGEVQDVYPATALQEGLMARSMSTSGAYVKLRVFRCVASFDPEQLREWLQRTMQKLPILRTAMATSAEHRFLQVVLSEPRSVEILRAPSLQEAIAQVPQLSMALGTPLTRILVAVVADCDGPFVLWHAHHAMYDMSTIDLIMRHLVAIATGAGMLPSPPTFASFVSYCLEIRKNPEGKAFWSQQLLNCPESCFPLNSEGMAATSPFRTNALHKHCFQYTGAKCEFTQANLFRAAWAYLLGCYELSDDVVFGVTNGGRYAPVPDCAAIVGPMIATSPMRVRLCHSSTVAEFLQRVSLQAVRIDGWEQVGLSAIHDLGADGQRACGFRTLINVQSRDAVGAYQDLAVPEGQDEPEVLDYALVLELFPREDDQVLLQLTYDNRALRQSQVAQIARQLEQVVAVFTADPGASLDRTAEAIERDSATARQAISAQPYCSSMASRATMHAAVQCGVSLGSIQSIGRSTPIQDVYMAASIQQPSAFWSRVVFQVGANLSRDEVLAAFEALYQQSPILRTRLVRAGQEDFMQVVVADTIHWSEALELEDHMAAESGSGMFGLGKPLSRFALIRGVRPDSKVHWVVVTAHAAVFDPTMTRALLEHLNATASGSREAGLALRTTSLPRDRPMLRDDGVQDSRAFWAQMLQDAPTPGFPEMPSKHAPLAAAHVQKSLVLPDGARGQPSFLASVHGAWALTLSKYQDTGDVVFGAGLALGPGPSLAPTLAIVPQRVVVSRPDASIPQFLATLGVQLESMASHSHIGLGRIKAVDSGCLVATSFQNLLIVHADSRQRSSEGGAFSLEPDAAQRQMCWNYALVVEVTPCVDDGSVAVAASYDSAVLEEVQVRRLLAHFEHVLLQTCDPKLEATLGNIDHVPASHWAELSQWNGCVPAPLERTVHDLFQSRVDMHPDEPAICARDGEWTYAELDALSEKLARWLQSLGVKHGAYVPLLFEKCGLAIVAMLAVLKAGATSVALDPSQPTTRLQGLVAGMGEGLVVASAGNRELATSLDRRVVVLDDKTARALGSRPLQKRLSEAAPVSPNGTAFVLFTSGSTGTPKGVLITHSAFASSIRGHGEVLRFTTGPGSRNFQYTAYTSDVHLGEIFTSLALGSCVCVPSDWDRTNDIAGAMRDLDVNWAFFTPSVATLLGPSEVPKLRTLVFGGETASPENFATWAPSLHLINSFGPAECSIWSHCVPRPVELGDVGSHIGYGVGCATWITDPGDYNKLLPIGAIGELLTEGPNVAAGYLNAPDKSEATFVTNPAWLPAGRPPMRIYRSGDLARFLPNGMVQFLGRRDHQVKINGLRIELGEIEHQIRTKVPDDITVAVDVVRTLPVGSAPVLAAFIAPMKPQQNGGQAKDGRSAARLSSPADSEAQNLLSLLVRDTSDRVRTALEGLEHALPAALPRHMVPAAFVPLREMPLNGSAKIDRRILKRLASLVPTEELVRLGTTTAPRQLQSPATVMERVLARLWGVALGRELDLDVRDSFFKVGGDSLSAMRLVSAARRDGFDLSVEQIFKSAVLRDMAQVVVFTDQECGGGGVPHGSPASSMDAAVVPPFASVGNNQAAQTGHAKAAALQLGMSESDIEDIYPCTALQEGLLALSQDVRGNYVAQMVHEMSPGLDYGRFQAAWSTVLDDWPILRTRFFPSLLDDGTVRMLQAVTKLKPRWQRPRTLEDYLRLDARKRMQTGDCMLRLAVFQDKKTKKHHFVMTIHHAVYDGWMMGLLQTSVRRAYAGMAKPATTPYSLFINRLEARDHEKSQSFWQRYVSGAPRTNWPELPSLDYRPNSSRVQAQTCALPAGRTTTSFTPATWLRAAFAILLGAYSSGDDVVFASTVYGRASGLLPSAELVAGPTLATVPVRIRVGRGKSVKSLLSEVQADAASMLAHEQDGLRNIRRYNTEALASVESRSLLVVQVDEADAVAPQDVDTEDADTLMFQTEQASGLDNGFLSCALVLEATVAGDTLRLVATHDDRVLSEDQVQRFLRQMAHIARQLCSDHSDGARVADVELAPPEDLEEMHDWNGKVAEPMDALIHELFHARARDQPKAEALVSWEGSLTFQELDDLSSRLAGHLWTWCGLRPGMRVPLIFEKSMWTVVAMMAVLKLGAANVALNPAQPPGLLQSLVSDVDGEFVLCSELHLSLARASFPKHFCVGPSVRAAGALSGANGAAAHITPDHLAFLLFTSGSTGKPKAIMIDHFAFCSSMRGHGETLCFDKGGRNLQFTAYTSDVSIGEIFTSLTRGATVCIPSDEERMNDLAGAMERMRVDWAFLTPSVASLLNPDHVPSLHTLVYGGETATVTNVTTWADRLHLINSFGPAETSVWSHAHPRFAMTGVGSDVGWSLGCATWIVDPDDVGRLMPVGAVGELLVEGPNVALGYYKDAEKTAHAFVQELPFLPGGRHNRIYRTGDLARWLPGGRVQFLGRKDTQAKLHGLKVDAREVEDKIRAALGGTIGLEVAVEVIHSPADPNDSRLVAFINTTPPGQPQDRINAALVGDGAALQQFGERTKGLRAALASVLPAFQVPSFFVPLTSMPLNASAKTDRKRLKALVVDAGFEGISRFALSSRPTVVAPQSEMERQLHKTWCAILGLAPASFGVEAHFFECGGDSIAAMKMVSLARARGVPLLYEDLYTHPRLGDLAARVAGKAPAVAGDWRPEVPAFSLIPPGSVNLELLRVRAADLAGVQPSAVVDAYPLTPVQDAMVRATLAQPGVFQLHQVFEITGHVDLDRLERAWNRVVAAHAILRTRIVKCHEGTLVQVVLRPVDGVLHADCPSTDVEEFLAADRNREFQFGQRLTRATLLNKKWFILALHHSVYDGWSLNKTCERLELEYACLGQGEGAENAVAPEPVKFSHFIQALQDQDQEAATAFWRDALSGAVTRPLGRKTAADRPPNRLLHHEITLPAGTQPKGHATPAELVCAAVGLAMHHQCRTADTVLHLVSTGRSLAAVPGLEDMVAPTVTSSPLRLRHGPPEATVPAFVAHVRDQLRALAPHEHYSFERAARLHADAEVACRAAPLVVVHPFDPYTRPAAGASGLQRREPYLFGGDINPLVLDISLVAHGKALHGLTVRSFFADEVLEEQAVRRLVAVLDRVVRAMVGTESVGSGDVDSLLRAVETAGLDELERTMTLTRRADER